MNPTERFRSVELAGHLTPFQILEGKTLRTHVAEIGPNGDPVRVFCRVKLASVLPDRALYGDPHKATCPACLAKLKRTPIGR